MPAPMRPVQVAIGERRRPQPFGQPGYVRVDTVHQGDLDGIKGLYHLNLVDEVTQFQLIGSVEHIDAACLVPVLDALLRAFPFILRGFHTDNGSEFVNREVAALPQALHIDAFTKSRARRCTDEGLRGAQRCEADEGADGGQTRIAGLNAVGAILFEVVE